MKIKSISSYKKDLQLTKPYKVAYQTFNKAENAFLEIELGNGMVGIGAAAEGEFVIGETMLDTVTNLQSDAIQNWVGRDIRHFRSLIAEAAILFPIHSATRTAIDIALHDAFCKFLGISVIDFYGRKHNSLPTSVTIGISDIKETLDEAEEYKAKGFVILKVKTGHDVENDIERCVKLREKFKDHFKIRVDANQGYDATQTMHFFESTRDLDIELIEQPMPVGSVAEMKKLPADLRKNIACDESLKNVESAINLAADPRACGIFNIKLMKCGGLLGAFEIDTVAHASGIDLFWGCFDESIVSISAALHAAFSCGNTRYIDLDGSLDLAEDIVEGGFVINNGAMRTLDGPGFGFSRIEN
jgi:L-alanine-DL-glutamate epimerase-like enolase superfamily enzyme